MHSVDSLHAHAWLQVCCRVMQELCASGQPYLQRLQWGVKGQATAKRQATAKMQPHHTVHQQQAEHPGELENTMLTVVRCEGDVAGLYTLWFLVALASANVTACAAWILVAGCTAPECHCKTWCTVQHMMLSQLAIRTTRPMASQAA